LFLPSPFQKRFDVTHLSSEFQELLWGSGKNLGAFKPQEDKFSSRYL
jgi:hypothetical protein